MFIDIHTHIDQHPATDVPEIVKRAQCMGVGAIIVAGVTLESSRKCVRLAKQTAELFAGVGFHPQDLKADLNDHEIQKLEGLASCEQVVVMSEIGLDFQGNSPDHFIQEKAFKTQISIARNMKLPVVWHMRNATRKTLQILCDEHIEDLGGAAHYFLGTEREAYQVVDMGCKISLAKPLLRIGELQRVAKNVPLSSIVLETDSYPQPFKKKRENWTEPRDIPLVARKLAELREIDLEEVMSVTTQNALDMLGKRKSPVQAAVCDKNKLND